MTTTRPDIPSLRHFYEPILRIRIALKRASINLMLIIPSFAGCDDATPAEKNAAGLAKIEAEVAKRDAAAAARNVGPDQVAAPITQAVGIRNKANELLLSQVDAERNKTLAALVNRSDMKCERVIRNFFQGVDPATGDAFWSVECPNKSSFALLVNSDASGSTLILDCDVVKKQEGTKCFEKLPDDDDAGSTEPAGKTAKAKPKDEAKLVYAELADLLEIGSGELSVVRERLGDPSDLAAANRCGTLMHGVGGAGGTVDRAAAVRARAEELQDDKYLDLRAAAINIQFCVTCATWGDEQCAQTKGDLRKAKKVLR